jgi:hypothetical protein
MGTCINLTTFVYSFDSFGWTLTPSSLLVSSSRWTQPSRTQKGRVKAELYSILLLKGKNMPHGVEDRSHGLRCKQKENTIQRINKDARWHKHMQQNRWKRDTCCTLPCLAFRPRRCLYSFVAMNSSGNNIKAGGWVLTHIQSSPTPHAYGVACIKSL